jgi:WD40 repeat protein
MQVNAVPHHSNTVFSISLQPGRNGQVFAVACDSILRILDTRSGSTGRSVIDMTSSCSTVILWSVMFSPTDSNLVAASGSQDGARLYDIRSPKRFIRNN